MERLAGHFEPGDFILARPAGHGSLPPLAPTFQARTTRPFENVPPDRAGAQFTNVPMTRAMLCAISLSSGKDSMPITEYPSSHGIR